MATDAGQETPAVIEDLLDNGHQYSLLQAYRLLQAYGGTDTRIDMRPSLKMDSARSVIEQVHQCAENHFVIELNIFSLYGRNGVLPAYLTEMLLQAEQDEQGQARQLLDLFNQRIYELLLESLQRSVLVSKDDVLTNNPLLQRLKALAGLDMGETHWQTSEHAQPLRYFKLLASPYRSARGLEALISDAMGHIPVSVTECADRQVNLSKKVQLSLGQHQIGIGQGALLGHRLNDKEGLFQLQIGPIAYSRFDQLLKDPEQWQRLRKLIRLYLKQPLCCELVFLLDCTDISSSQTGFNNWGQLGRNAWLLQPDFSSEEGQAYQLKARIALD